jgi:ribose 5-phosphate isomerase A
LRLTGQNAVGNVRPVVDPDDLKAMVGLAAVAFVSDGEILGVGTGSTVGAFIDALAASGVRPSGAVSSSEATSARLAALGIPVVEPGEAMELGLYVDGADEIDPHGNMTKGGGAALTREKIVASMADRYLCIVDESKLVDRLGRFPIPVEVVPMADPLVIRRFAELGGVATVRLTHGSPVVTDNGMHIVDVAGLTIPDPLEFELEVSGWPGVVTAGVFARQRASIALVGTPEGVRTIDYRSAAVDRPVPGL